MLNTSASGSASPVVSTTMTSGSTFLMISVTAASNSPSNEQQTQPPPSSAIRTFLPSMIFVSIAISPNSFITIAILSPCIARMWRSNVVLPLPSGPVISVIGVREVMDRKSQCQNPKFDTMFEKQIRMTQTRWLMPLLRFGNWDFLSFEFASDFEFRIWLLAFHISNWYESRDRFVDSRQFGRSDYFVNVF